MRHLGLGEEGWGVAAIGSSWRIRNEAAGKGPPTS